MKAVVAHAFGPPDTLRYEDYPDAPPPGPEEIRFNIVAAGINPSDGRLSRGTRPDLWTSFPRVCGREAAGIVDAVGEGVVGYKRGDRVYAFSAPDQTGTWADQITLPVANIAHAPESISLTEAASLPVAALTVWVTMFVDFDLTAGQTLLVNGAAGGCGSLAVQIAKAAGVRVIGAVSTEKVELARDLGCDEIVNYQHTPIDTVLHDIDAVLDASGGGDLIPCYKVLKRGGWLGSLTSPVDPILDAQFGVRSMKTYGRVLPGLLARIAEEVDAGRVKSVVTETYPMSSATNILELINGGHTLGKLVLLNQGKWD